MARNDSNSRGQGKEVCRPVCPQKECLSHTTGSHDVIVHSYPKPDTIRYCCKTCGRTFSITTGAEGVRTNVPEAARNYALWLSQRGYSTVEIAFVVGVSKRTVYRWIKKRSPNLMLESSDSE